MAEQELTAEKPQMTAEQSIVHDTSEYAMLFDSAKFNQAWRVATAFSKSGLVPEHFANNPAGVFVVLHMATRLDLDPFMALQKVYMVHGRPGMEAQLIIALVNARGPFKGPIQWEVGGAGDSRYWTAYATHKTTGERCEATVTWAMVKAEEWASKKGSKWMTIPDLMGRYRSATFLARLYCPEVILGLSTADELEDATLEMDSGIKVSRKPRVALPEAPEVDPAAVEGFTTRLAEVDGSEKLLPQVGTFISEIAKVNKQTVEAVKAQAGTAENFPAFWQSFLGWQAKQEKKGPGRPKNPPKSETQPETQAPKQEGATGGTSGHGEPPRAITEATLNRIRKICDKKDVPLDMVARDAEVSTLEELTEAAGVKIAAFYEATA